MAIRELNLKAFLDISSVTSFTARFFSTTDAPLRHAHTHYHMPFCIKFNSLDVSKIFACISLYFRVTQDNYSLFTSRLSRRICLWLPPIHSRGPDTKSFTSNTLAARGNQTTRTINSRPTQHKIHIYFITGILDITATIKDANYEEVILMGSVDTVA